MAEEIQMITLTAEDGTEFTVEVVETTKIAGVDYLLVANENDEAFILKDTAPEGSEEAVYEPVTDEKEQGYVSQIFAELLDDIELE